MSEPYTLYHGDCLDVLPTLAPGSVDAVICDPPYPNSAGHFVDDIPAAIEFLTTYVCDRWFVFWDEMEIPPVPLPLVARHIWHRSNTNRPDNYESIYEFNVNGVKQPSRIFAHPVVYSGLTGCVEATGHPTQKNLKLMIALMTRCRVGLSVFDPFMGSGTTGAACANTRRRFIGIERDLAYFKAASDRIATAYAPLRMMEAV